jgi:general secretion pathway protein C
MKRLPLLLSLLALIVLSASIAYWVMQLYQPPQRPLAAAPIAALPEPSIDAAATLFGGQAAAAVASNYQLTGVVAAGRDSVAIIVADGAPARALPIGKELAPGVTISEVHPRYVMLSDSGVMKRIDLATDTKAAVGLNGQAQAAIGAAGVPEPPMAPGPVQAPDAVEPHDQPPPAQNQIPPPPPEPVQMPAPVRSPGSPVAAPPSAQ